MLVIATRTQIFKIMKKIDTMQYLTAKGLQTDMNVITNIVRDMRLYASNRLFWILLEDAIKDGLGDDKEDWKITIRPVR